MKIEKNKVVALSYQLEVDGKIADKASSESPLEYIHGTGMLLPKFEEEVAGKEPGEEFKFTLSPAEGYGEIDPRYLVELPKESFAIDGQIREELLQPGRVIPMYNSAGQVVQGTVKTVTENAVTMDFNHPMAGKTLNFSGRVESVRDASEKELTEGLHGEYLPQEECHCNGNCKHGEGGCDCSSDECGHSEGKCGHGKCGCNK